MRDELAILRPGPATRTVKINTTFHDAVLEIPHPIDHFPGADRITTECPEMAIHRFQPGAVHGAERHLVTSDRDRLPAR